MKINKIIKNAMLVTLLSAPLSTFALFDWGHDDYYDDRPHLFGHGHYRDSRVREENIREDQKAIDRENQMRKEQEERQRFEERQKLEETKKPVEKK